MSGPGWRQRGHLTHCRIPVSDDQASTQAVARMERRKPMRDSFGVEHRLGEERDLEMEHQTMSPWIIWVAGRQRHQPVTNYLTDFSNGQMT